MDQDVIKRYWKNVIKGIDPQACWSWLAAIDNNGYGRLYKGPGKSPYYAHRLSYEIAYGPIPAGMLICHKCDNPVCSNPSHLFIGTQKDNLQDAARKGRARGKITSGEIHPNSKLTNDQVRNIRLEYTKRYDRGGVTLKSLGKKYGVHYSTIQLIVTNKSRRNDGR